MKSYTSLYKNIYSKWRGLIEGIYFIGWAIFTLAELVSGIIAQTRAGEAFTFSYAAKFVIFPSATALIVIIYTCCVYHSKKASENVKNYTTIFMMMVISFVLSLVHSYFFISYALFLTPIIITAAFSAPLMTLVTSIISFILLWINAFMCNIFDNVYSREEHLMNALEASILLIYVAVTVFLIVSIHQGRERAITNYQRDNRRLSQAASEDGLTGLYNHTTFYRDLEQKLKEGQEKPKSLCLAMIDIDNFKQVNDSYGHDTGDIILKRVSRILRLDLEDYGTVYRYGGDEFAAILSCDADQSRQILNSVLRKTRSIQEDRLADRKITLSIGLHPITNFSDSAETVFSAADQVLYVAKIGGKNQIAVR